MSFLHMKDQPHRQEKLIRLGCGAIFGLALGISFGFYTGDVAIGSCVALAVVACAVGSLLGGDSFWDTVVNLFWWW